MFSKSPVALAVGLSVLAVAMADDVKVNAGAGYPDGMPSACIPYYTPPTVCPTLPVPWLPTPPSIPPPGKPTPGGPNPPIYPPTTPKPTPGKPTTPYPTPTTTIYPGPAPTASSISQCNTGDAHCCNSVSKASGSGAASLLGLLGVVVQDVNVLVGLGCTPLSVVGIGSGANCAQQPVCCQNNNFNGLINIGCSPISL